MRETTASTNVDPDLLKVWHAEEHRPFSGWDFSSISGRMIEENPPWQYEQLASELLHGADSALDMGTGGGERLLQMQDAWPSRMIATEDYPPNVFLSAQRLAPRASVVVANLDEQYSLPFADNVFDAVINRHSAMDASEVARVLRTGGRFLTQQIHGLYAAELLAEFDVEPQWPDSTAEKYAKRLSDANVTIVDVRDWSGDLRFTDVGAIIYYLKAIPWMVPGFSVDTHLPVLCHLQDRLDRGESLIFSARKYLIEAINE